MDNNNRSVIGRSVSSIFANDAVLDVQAEVMSEDEELSPSESEFIDSLAPKPPPSGGLQTTETALKTAPETKPSDVLSGVGYDPDSVDVGIASVDKFNVAIVPSRGLDAEERKILEKGGSMGATMVNMERDPDILENQKDPDILEDEEIGRKWGQSKDGFKNNKNGIIVGCTASLRDISKKGSYDKKVSKRDSSRPSNRLSTAAMFDAALSQQGHGLAPKYPPDCYSFMAIHSPFKKPGFFLFGFMVFVFQMLFILYMILSKVHRNMRNDGEIDNPSDGFFASFIPANVTTLVAATQTTAVLSYCVFADSSLKDCVLAVELFPRFDRFNKGNDRVTLMALSSVLRFSQGFLAILATLLLIVTTDDVIEIILNFAAVNFISTLDEIAFELAKWGKYGPALEMEAKRIEKRPLPFCMYRKNRHTRYMLTVVPIGLMLLCLVIAMMTGQSNNDLWVTKTLRVQFQESTGLESYSGCFEMDPDLSFYKRKNYNSYHENPDQGTIGYCKEERKWRLFMNVDEEHNPCDVDRTNELAHSGTTDYFDISSSFDDSWYTASGTPLDLYFFEAEESGGERVSMENCGSFLNNGKCDLFFNTLGYQYDGGDCCVSTCTKPSCGQGGADFAFETDIPHQGRGFRDCVNPAMVPVSIVFNGIASSRDRNMLKVTESDLEDYVREKGIDFWTETPQTPLLFVYCDEVNILSIYVDDTMNGAAETLMVEDGARCRISLSNTTNPDEHWDNDPIWWVNYTVYHGNDTTNEIISANSAETELSSFHRIPDCYFDMFSDFIDLSTAYSSDTDSTWALDWLVNDDSGYSSCDDGFLIERFALAALNFAAPMFLASDSVDLASDHVDPASDHVDPASDHVDLASDHVDLASDPVDLATDLETLEPEDIWSTTNTTPGSSENNGLRASEQKSLSTMDGDDSSENDGEDSFIASEKDAFLYSIHSFDEDTLWIHDGQQCRWGNVGCHEGSVEALAVRGKNLNGFISTSLGLLTELRRFDYDHNGLTGTIPTEIGLLKKLSQFHIDMNKLTGSIPIQFGLLKNMREINLDHNQLTGIVPTELGKLAEARDIELIGNHFMGPIPTEIGQLQNLARLSLSHNMMTGTIPSVIIQMNNLQLLELADNHFEGTIPREIGKARLLVDFSSGKNNMTGPIPTFIGKLKNLEKLDLEFNDFTGSIPTEIGMITSLKFISLRGNSFTGTIPSEIGLLTELRELRIEGNAFYGTIPYQITYIERLRVLSSDDNLVGIIPKNMKTLNPCVLCEGERYDLLPTKRDSHSISYYENSEWGIDEYSCPMLLAAKQDPEILISEYACDALKLCVACGSGRYIGK